MKNLRNKDQPRAQDTADTYLKTSWDIITAVYRNLTQIGVVAAAILEGNWPPWPINPDFTYDVNDNLIQIDYSAGDQKLLTYNGNDDLLYLDYLVDGTTYRKEFFYGVGGELDYITEGYI